MIMMMAILSVLQEDEVNDALEGEHVALLEERERFYDCVDDTEIPRAAQYRTSFPLQNENLHAKNAASTLDAHLKRVAFLVSCVQCPIDDPRISRYHPTHMTGGGKWGGSWKYHRRRYKCYRCGITTRSHDSTGRVYTTMHPHVA